MNGQRKEDYQVARCPACNINLRIGTELLGRRMRCSKCGHEFTTSDTTHPPAPPVVEIAKPAVAIQAWRPKRTKRRPRFTISTIRDVTLLAITIISTLLVYRQYAAGNLDVSRLMAILTERAEQQAATAEANPQQPQIQPPVDRSASRNPRSNSPSYPSEPKTSSPSERDIPPFGGSRRDSSDRSTLAPLLDDKPKRPSGIVLAKVPLAMTNGRQMFALPDGYDQSSIRLAAVTGFRQTARILPADGVLSEGARVEICPFGDKSVYLVAQIVEPVGESPQLIIESKTSFEWIGGDRLTGERLKRKRIALVKQANLAAARYTAAATEISNLVAYVESRQAKPLRDVGIAKDRISALQRLLPDFDAQVAYAKQQVAQFDQFYQTLETAFNDVIIVLETDNPNVVAPEGDTPPAVSNEAQLLVADQYDEL